jgi:hypothetical protein
MKIGGSELPTVITVLSALQSKKALNRLPIAFDWILGGCAI